MSLNPRNSSFIFLISWLLYLLQLTSSVTQKSCKLDDVFHNTCGANATCEEANDNEGVCKCDDQFYLKDDKCIPAPQISPNNNENDLINNSGSSTALWILIPCFILILGGVVVFLTKRLKLIEKLYQFRVRRYNTVFVTSLQDDDAPIT